MANMAATDEPNRLIASDKVDGTAVYDRAGEKLGSVRNFMVDKRSGKAEYAVLQFGGFLGIGTDHYPIPWDMLDYDPEQGGYVVDITREQLEDAPRYQEANDPTFDHSYGESVYSYYGRAYPFL